MPYLEEGLVAVVLVAIALIALVALRPSLTAARGGKVLAFLALLVLPVVATAMGLSAHMEQSKSTEFCLSCHVMEPYGKSLYVDDAGLAAGRALPEQAHRPRPRLLHLPHRLHPVRRLQGEAARAAAHLRLLPGGDPREDRALRALQQPRVPALPRRRALVRGERSAQGDPGRSGLERDLLPGVPRRGAQGGGAGGQADVASRAIERGPAPRAVGAHGGRAMIGAGDSCPAASGWPGCWWPWAC